MFPGNTVCAMEPPKIPDARTYNTNMILVTGSTGYVGGRLVPRLLDAGHDVRVLVRSPDKLRRIPWASEVDIREGDVLDRESLSDPLEGVDSAYYLIHGMDEGREYADRDRQGAQNFVDAAGPDTRIVYLGGIQPQTDDPESISTHLRSRIEVGRILRSTGNAVEFRAGPVIGSGSASFEMVRYLTERLPVMVAPRWVSTEVSPVGIRDVLAYLVAVQDADDLPPVMDIGGDRLTFREMMLGYADVRGLSRTIMPLPVLAPALAARWVGLVTPIHNRLAVPLVKGMTLPIVADTTAAERHFPDIQPMSYHRAVELALQRTEEGHVETRWTTAQGGHKKVELTDERGLFIETRRRETSATPDDVFRIVSGLGGDRGWIAWDALWSLRGLIDKLFGGPGLRRGRRDPDELREGETVDFWRVEVVEPGRRLRLRAEMRVPGKAWLEWNIEQGDEGDDGGRGQTVVEQRALFEPHGLPGFLYWYSIYPMHGFIFSSMIDGIVARAEDAP